MLRNHLLVALHGVRRHRGHAILHVAGLAVRLACCFIVLLVRIAFAVGAPVAFLLMRRWLDDFAYRIELGPVPFLLVGMGALVIALLTVSYHVVCAATVDPVKALRYERARGDRVLQAQYHLHNSLT